MTKSSQLQIRVSPAQKAQIQARAAAVGMDVSNWVLQKILPPGEVLFQRLCTSLAESGEPRSFLLAELNDLLSGLGSSELTQTVRNAPESPLPEFEAAYVASMVEQACAMKSVVPPLWPRLVNALAEPWFASSLQGLRLHLLDRLNETLADQETSGELHLVGGAVMCLVYEARQR